MENIELIRKLAEKWKSIPKQDYNDEFECATSSGQTDDAFSGGSDWGENCAKHDCADELIKELDKLQALILESRRKFKEGENASQNNK